MPGSTLRFDNPVKHGVSSLLLLVDVAMSRMAVVSYHLQVSTCQRLCGLEFWTGCAVSLLSLCKQRGADHSSSWLTLQSTPQGPAAASYVHTECKL